MANKVNYGIKRIYERLREVLALYQKTDCYNKIPSGESYKGDIWDYIGEKIEEIKHEVAVLFIDDDIKLRLINLVLETEVFVRSYEQPGVVQRWRVINPNIMFFSAAFELLESCPSEFKKMQRGISMIHLDSYPDEDWVKERNEYFNVKRENFSRNNLQYDHDKIFEEELLNTLELVFNHDFEDYL